MLRNLKANGQRRRKNRVRGMHSPGRYGTAQGTFAKCNNFTEAACLPLYTKLKCKAFLIAVGPQIDPKLGQKMWLILKVTSQ